MNTFNEYIKKYDQKGIEYLKANVPEIQKIESFYELKELKLKSKNCINDKLILQYETTTPNVLSDIIRKLLESKTVNKNNILYTSTRNKGTPSEVNHIGLRFYNSQLEIHLEVHK